MADVGFVGLVRDEETLVASTYADRYRADLTGREAFVLDPMLATGGTLQTVIAMLAARGVTSVTAVALLAAPEGLKRLEEAFPGGRAGHGAGGHRGGGRAAAPARLHLTPGWVTPETGCSARSEPCWRGGRPAAPRALGPDPN